MFTLTNSINSMYNNFNTITDDLYLVSPWFKPSYTTKLQNFFSNYDTILKNDVQRISETEYRFVVPGYEKSEVNVSVKNSVLIVECKSERENFKSKASFKQILNDRIDTKKHSATLENGFLTVKFELKEDNGDVNIAID